MNILYISNLYGNPWAGPTYSVPAQISAQAEVDNVFWYNLSKSKQSIWNNYSYYHDIEEYPLGTISSLPESFCKPDIIVIEQFYKFAKKRIRKEILDLHIPYVIIPRGELTTKAQDRKPLKKKLANTLFMAKFAHSATAIHFLTEQEVQTTDDNWYKKAIVISNGINMPPKTKDTFSQGKIKAVYIGRIEPYQKGLDLLLDACYKLRDILLSNNFFLTICGPDREGCLNGLKEKVAKYGLDPIISFRDGVFGEEKEKLLIASDIFIQTSRFEGHPMGVIEALSYGLPCVVTQGTNMKEIVEDADAGYGADNEVNSIVEALSKMISSFSDIQRMSDNAKKLARKYDWEEIARITHEEYSKLILDPSRNKSIIR